MFIKEGGAPITLTVVFGEAQCSNCQHEVRDQAAFLPTNALLLFLSKDLGIPPLKVSPFEFSKVSSLLQQLIHILKPASICVLVLHDVCSYWTILENRKASKIRLWIGYQTQPNKQKLFQILHCVCFIKLFSISIVQNACLRNQFNLFAKEDRVYSFIYLRYRNGTNQ